MRNAEAGLGDEATTATSENARSTARHGTWTTPGTMIGDRLIVEGLLGAGGMGCVVLARHRELGELRAVKLLQPERAGSEDARRRLVREARAAARIQSPHVVRVFDVVSEGPAAPYVVMEYLEGETLAARLRRQPLSVDLAASVVVQACEALAEAHHAGTIHRDLKPSNLFLTSVGGQRDFVKVLDFGIAKTVESRIDDWTQSHALLASPAYASPEQLRASKDVDARADIWSLGAILYESLTGQLPFGGETLADLSSRILRDRPVSVCTHRPDLPVEIERIVERCLEKDAAARFVDVAALVEALAPFSPVAAADCLARIRTIGVATPGAPPLESGASARFSLEESTLTQASIAGPRRLLSRPLTPTQRWMGAGTVLIAGLVLAALVAGARRSQIIQIGSEAATTSIPRPNVRTASSVTSPSPIVAAPSALPQQTEPRRQRTRTLQARPASQRTLVGHMPTTFEELPLDHLLDQRK